MLRYHAITEAGRHAVLSVDTDEHDEAWVPTQIRTAPGVRVVGMFPDRAGADVYAQMCSVPLSSESAVRVRRCRSRLR
jgi:hypothetical protein